MKNSTPPFTVTHFVCKGEVGIKTLRWTAHPSASSYQIRQQEVLYGDTANNSWTIVGDTKKMEYIVTGLKECSHYKFQILPLAADGSRITVKMKKAERKPYRIVGGNIPRKIKVRTKEDSDGTWHCHVADYSGLEAYTSAFVSIGGHGPSQTKAIEDFRSQCVTELSSEFEEVVFEPVE